MLALVLGLARASPALALFKKKKKKADSIDEYSSRLVKLYWPIMANLGFSGAVGLATGLALRVQHLCLASPPSVHMSTLCYNQLQTPLHFGLCCA